MMSNFVRKSTECFSKLPFYPAILRPITNSNSSSIQTIPGRTLLNQQLRASTVLPNKLDYIIHRQFSCFTCKLQKIDEKENAIIESKKGPYAGLTTAEKVKKASVDASYTGVILVGLGIFGALVYALGSELFSSSSPSGLFGHGLKKCKQNTQIIDILGEPIKGYGETTRRKRRRHVSHVEFYEEGVKFMRMKFYIEGPHRKGTVTLEAKENNKGKYEIRFIYVELDGYPHRVIVVEDNR